MRSVLLRVLGDHGVVGGKVHHDKRTGKLRIELGAGAAGDLFEDLGAGHGGAVGAVGGHGVERIREAHDARGEGDRLAGKAVRVAAAVVTLVVVEDSGEDILEHGDVLEYAVADLGVELDEGKLVVGETAGLAEHGFRDADLADVVHQARDVDAFGLFGRVARGEREAGGEMGHALGMAAGVSILGVDGGGQGLNGAHEHRLLVADQTGVFEERAGVAGGGLDELHVVAVDLRVLAVLVAADDHGGELAVECDGLDEDAALRRAVLRVGVVGVRGEEAADFAGRLGEQAGHGGSDLAGVVGERAAGEEAPGELTDELGFVDELAGEVAEGECFVEAVADKGDEALRVVEVEHGAAEGVEEVDGLVGLCEFVGEALDDVGVLRERGQVVDHPLEGGGGALHAGGIEDGDLSHGEAGGVQIKTRCSARIAEGLCIKGGRGERKGEGERGAAAPGFVDDRHQPAAGKEFAKLGGGLAGKFAGGGADQRSDRPGAEPEAGEAGFVGLGDQGAGGVGPPDGEGLGAAAVASGIKQRRACPGWRGRNNGRWRGGVHAAAAPEFGLAMTSPASLTTSRALNGLARIRLMLVLVRRDSSAR